MGKRLLIGILKGLVIGGAIGALLHFALNAAVITTGWVNYLLYAGVGALAGVFGGRAPWKPGAWVASILKGVFGLVVGAILYALGSRFLPAAELPVPGSMNALLAYQPMFFAPVLAMVYAALVELDDGGEQPEPEVASGVRVGKISLEDIDVGEEDEQPAAKPTRATKKN